MVKQQRVATKPILINKDRAFINAHHPNNLYEKRVMRITQMVIPFLVAIMGMLAGCANTGVTASWWTDLPPGREFLEAERYDPGSTLLKDGQITPDAAIAKARKVAKKYCGRYADIDSATIEFHNPREWFVSFYDKADRKRQHMSVCVSINKATGEAILEGVE